jgi:group II intron reverse transcriptase/maturase
VLQQALKDLLEPIFEPIFSDQSFGYRPGRSAHDALNEVRRLREQHDWIVDADIKGFFDNVDHDILLDLVNEQVSDGSILRLLRSILQSGVSFEGVILPTEQGTPQGGVISPLLANIYLNHLDRRLEERGYAFVRYADDFLIFCMTREEAESALAFVHEVVSTDLDLELSPEKTQLCCIRRGEDSTIPLDLCRPFEFLGFRIHNWWMIPVKRAVKRFKDKIRGLTIRHYNYQTDVWIPKLNSVIRGWSNYYRIKTVKTLFKKLSRWIRIRLRMVFLRRRYRKVRQNRGTLLPSYYTYTNSFFMELGLITPEELL